MRMRARLDHCHYVGRVGTARIACGGEDTGSSRVHARDEEDEEPAYD
jgi:hypothetical protein